VGKFGSDETGADNTGSDESGLAPGSAPAEESSTVEGEGVVERLAEVERATETLPPRSSEPDIGERFDDDDDPPVERASIGTGVA